MLEQVVFSHDFLKKSKGWSNFFIPIQTHIF